MPIQVTRLIVENPTGESSYTSTAAKQEIAASLPGQTQYHMFEQGKVEAIGSEYYYLNLLMQSLTFVWHRQNP
jgi:hypothetical protein